MEYGQRGADGLDLRREEQAAAAKPAAYAVGEYGDLLSRT